MEFQKLYDFTYSLTKLYEKASDRTSFVEGIKSAFSLFFAINEIKIYLLDEYSFLLKDFTKPWENLLDDDFTNEIKKYYDDFLFKKSKYIALDNILYFPIVYKNKTLGLIKIKAVEKINENNDFFKIFPLISAQISMYIVQLKNNEQIKISSKFHQTIRNIAQITQTQYELDYILPILGEMID